ncbi:MAG: ATP-grasp domain-containing protein [Pseudonocardia sp.]
MTQDRSDHLLVIGSSDQQYREYAMREFAAAYPLWLVTDRPPTWERRYCWGVTQVDMSDRADPTRLLAAVEDLVAEVPVGGVVCCEEEYIVLAAHVVERLGLRGMTAEVAGRCRDKYRTREAVRLAGLPGPTAVAAGTVADTRRVVERIGLPVVVKPRTLGGALGIRRVDNLSDVPAAFAAATAAADWCPGVPVPADAVLVESYLDGPNISLGSVVFDGVIHPMAIARVSTVCPPHFEETDHVVDGFDPLFDDGEFLRLAQDVHTALGIRDGATLSQWRLTDAGPMLVEVNGRLGGDLIPHIGARANGVNMARAVADAAMGVSPRVKRTPHSAAIITFLLPDHSLVVDSVEVVGTPPPGTRIELLAGAGTELVLPPLGFKARYAFVIAEAADVAECHRLVAEASGLVWLRERAGAGAARTAVVAGG